MPKEYQIRMFSVQAEQLTPQTVDSVALWCGGQVRTEFDAIDKSQKFVALNVPTMDGVRRASEGDYVVRTDQGGFAVMPADQFQMRFEEA